VVTIKKKKSAQIVSLPTTQSNSSEHSTPMPEEPSETVADCAFTKQVDSAERPKATGHEKTLQSGWIDRGKNLFSGEAGAIGTAAAIVVGAALVEVELIPGLIIGAGAILLGKLFPKLTGYVRPMIKGVVRTGFSASQKTREVMAEASEQVRDLVAEVKQEQDQELCQQQPAWKKSGHPIISATNSALPAL
jgi:hypothetical protein